MLKTNLADHPKPLLTFAPRASICRIYGDNSMNLSIIIYKTWTVLGSKEQPCKKKRQKNKNFVLEKHQPKPHPSAKDSARSGPSKYWGFQQLPGAIGVPATGVRPAVTRPRPGRLQLTPAAVRIRVSELGGILFQQECVMLDDVGGLTKRCN